MSPDFNYSGSQISAFILSAGVFKGTCETRRGNRFLFWGTKLSTEYKLWRSHACFSLGVISMGLFWVVDGGSQENLFFILTFLLLVPRWPEFGKECCVCHPDRIPYQKDCLYTKLAFHFRILFYVIFFNVFFKNRSSFEFRHPLRGATHRPSRLSSEWLCRAGEGVLTSVSLGACCKSACWDRESLQPGRVEMEAGYRCVLSTVITTKVQITVTSLHKGPTPNVLELIL